MKDGNKGSVLEGIVVLICLILIIFLFALPRNTKGPLRPIHSLTGYETVNSTTNPSSQTTGGTLTSSSYSRSVSLNTGNAAYSYQPDEEYITIENTGSQSVNITGWRLTNAKSNRPFDQSGNVTALPNDEVIIPRADSGNVVLAPGERAIITTGIGPNQTQSFKENECSGYLERTDGYNFTPSLNLSCVLSSREGGVSGQALECQKFVENMSSCHIPVFDNVDSQGNVCRNCADNTVLPTSCISYLKTHYSYQGCIANHRNDAGFYLNTWRVYLGSRWELWSQDHETISLLDQYGHLVDSISY